MTADELREALQEMSLPQAALARMTGKTARIANDWTRGRVEVPRYVAAILALLRALPVRKRARLVAMLGSKGPIEG